MSRRRKTRLADDRRLTAHERRKLGARTYEPGTCVFCGITLGKRGGYDDLFCSYECCRWYARAAHANGYRFVDLGSRGGEAGALRDYVKWLEENPGSDEGQREHRRELAMKFMAILSDVEGSGE